MAQAGGAQEKESQDQKNTMRSSRSDPGAEEAGTGKDSLEPGTQPRLPHWWQGLVAGWRESDQHLDPPKDKVPRMRDGRVGVGHKLLL